MAIGGTPVPKRELITLILRHISVDQIRSMLKIQADTDLKRRLDDFSKIQLLEVLQSSDGGNKALEEAKANYPLTSNPTLYLISVNKWPEREVLFDVTRILAEKMQDAAVWFGNDRTVNSVYLITAARDYRNQNNFLEVPLVYTKKIEYVVADPNEEEYGELKTLWSLEKALVWYSHQFRHALLLSSDFQAVKPILHYCFSKLGISWQLPYLSEEMLMRLAEGAKPRTASFSRLEENPTDDFDIQTMTISDQVLGESRSFQRLAEDETRHQTFGFYSSHPDLSIGGLGISRQYGRIWTPTRLRKDSLLALSINLIKKTEKELNRESKANLGGYISYYRNHPITILGKSLISVKRLLFENLVEGVISARRSPNHESTLEFQLITELVRENKSLDIVAGLEIHCKNCGDYLLRCPKCQFPFIPVFNNDDQLTFQCPNHPEERIQNDQSVVCECGEEVDITFSADIKIFPGAELLKSLHTFLSLLEGQEYDGNFQIRGNILRLVQRPKTKVPQYKLEDFRAWRARAHLHQRNLSDDKKDEYVAILNRIKEKCIRNNRHPKQEMCDQCMKEKITPSRIKIGDDLCLPRIYGYVIDEDFDGIHHGHEIADLKYQEALDDTGVNLDVWVHLKSRHKHKAKGLGRSVDCIKALYTQYCYSAYAATTGKKSSDVIGISVPNFINIEVIRNFEYLSNQLGIPLIILDENDWTNIIDAALEKAAIDKV